MDMDVLYQRINVPRLLRSIEDLRWSFEVHCCESESAMDDVMSSEVCRKYQVPSTSAGTDTDTDTPSCPSFLFGNGDLMHRAPGLEVSDVFMLDKLMKWWWW